MIRRVAARHPGLIGVGVDGQRQAADDSAHGRPPPVSVSFCVRSYGGAGPACRHGHWGALRRVPGDTRKATEPPTGLDRISGAQAQATLAGLRLLVLVGKKFYMRYEWSDLVRFA